MRHDPCGSVASAQKTHKERGGRVTLWNCRLVTSALTHREGNSPRLCIPWTSCGGPGIRQEGRSKGGRGKQEA